jgi:hypothetical protein
MAVIWRGDGARWDRQARGRDVVQLEIVQHRFHGLMPCGGHVQAGVVQRTTLARPLKSNHFITCITQIEKGRGQFFDVAVKAAKENDGAFGVFRCETVGRQKTTNFAGGTKIETRSENMSICVGFFGQRQKLALPVTVVRYARSGIAHLGQHAGFTDPTEPTVHLKVHADVGMQVMETDGESAWFHGAPGSLIALGSALAPCGRIRRM